MSLFLLPLSPLHRHLVRRTFMQLVTHKEQSTKLFHQRLNELNADLLSVFAGDDATQPHRAIEMLALVISLLDNRATLRTQVKAIRAQQQHITDEHFRQAGEALLWVIEQQLGNTFTGDIQRAWQAFYRFLGQLAEESP
jgi:hemoglobin-like flavoprotein